MNKLGEYMDASPRRRRSIVKDQKRPRDVVVGHYNDARRGIADFLVAGSADDAQVRATIQRLHEQHGDSTWQDQDAALSAEALAAFLDGLGRLDLEGFGVERGDDSPPKLAISGVEVSVRPEVVLRRNLPGAGPVVQGAVLLYIVKTGPLSDDAAAYVATVLHRYLSAGLPDGCEADREHCFVVDVFGRRVFNAPRSHVQRMRNIEAACEEIRLWWNATEVRSEHVGQLAE